MSSGLYVPRPHEERLFATASDYKQLEPSLKTIFDDIAEGVLVLDSAGRRVYSNPALNELVGTNACLPTGVPEPPAYIPFDQRQRYLLTLKGSSSLLTMDGPGTAMTWLELMSPTRGRVRAKVTISAFSGPAGWRFAVWLFNLEASPRLRAPAMAGSAPQSRNDWAALPVIGSLTRREKDVLQLLLDGRRVSSIANHLCLSPQTVRNHLKAIFRKVGTHSQAELLDALRPAGNEVQLLSGFELQRRDGNPSPEPVP